MSEHLVNRLTTLDDTFSINVKDILGPDELSRIESLEETPEVENYLLTVYELLSLDTSELSVGHTKFVLDTPFVWSGSEFKPLARVSLRAFGAVGDGTTNDSAAYMDAISSGWPLKGAGADSYLVTSTSRLTDTTVDFDGNNCQFLIGDTELLSASASFTLDTDINSFSDTTADLSDGTTGTGEVTVLNVASGSGYASGDIVKVFSDDFILGETSSRRRGEYAQVFSVSGNAITLFTRILGIYTTNPRVAKMNRDVSIRFTNHRVRPAPNALESWSTPAMRIEGYVSPLFGHIEYNDLLERALLLVSCYKPKTFFLRGERIRTSQEFNAFGYLIHEIACHAGYHHRPEGRDVRHVYTCSAFSLTEQNSSNIKNFGGTSGSTVDHGYGFNCKASAFDTHADGENITFAGCVAESPHKGNLGALFNYGLRGRNNKCVGCFSIGGNGYRAFSDFGSVDNSRDHEFNDCSHVANQHETEPRAAFEVFGTASGSVKGVVVNNPKVYARGGVASAFRSEWGDMEVRNPVLKMEQSETADVFKAVEGGVIRSYGGSLDYTGATGSNLRTIRCFNNDSQIYVDSLRIITNPNWALLVDMGNADGVGIATNIDLTGEPSFNSTGIAGTSGSPTCYVDWVVNGGRDGTVAKLAAVTRNSSGGFPIDVGLLGSPVIYYTVIATTSEVNGASFTAGHFEGQELVVRNHPTSSNNIILTSGTNGDFGPAVTLEIGKAFRLRWDGFNWVSA